MGCFSALLMRFLNWLAIENIPQSEKSIIRDLMKIGIMES